MRSCLLLLVVAACGGRASDPGDAAAPEGTGAPGAEYPVTEPSFGDGGGRPMKSCDCPATGYEIQIDLAGQTIRLGGPSGEVPTEPFCKNVTPSCIFAQTWKTDYTLTFGACAADGKTCVLFRYNTDTRNPVKDEGELVLGDRRLVLSRLTTGEAPLTFRVPGPLVATFTGLADGAPVTLRANVCVAGGTVIPF